MKTSFLSLALLLSLAAPSAFAAKTGAPAPDFSGMDIDGKPVSLSQYKGKYVVLEWHNKDCPYVKAQYESGNMQKTQKEWTGKGVVWLSVVSSAKGNQGFVDPVAAKKDIASTNTAATDMILDSDGKIGHAYGAQTTPHMFIIDPKGLLVYNGAIDDHAANDKSDVTGTNYVALALKESMAGTAVSHPTSKPYGCSVKY